MNGTAASKEAVVDGIASACGTVCVSPWRRACLGASFLAKPERSTTYWLDTVVIQHQRDLGVASRDWQASASCSHQAGRGERKAGSCARARCCGVLHSLFMSVSCVVVW